MIQKYTYGTPFETDAIVTSIPASEGTPAYGTISTENGFSFTYDMDDNVLSMVWANQTAESTNVDTFMKATVPTSQTIQKIKSPSTEHTTSS